MQIELKPCPDCGGKVIVREIYQWDGVKEFVPQCTKCRGGLFYKKPDGTVGGWERESVAAEAWNKAAEQMKQEGKG